MDREGLPRLPARVIEATSMTSASESPRVYGASTARRVVTRSLMPKSAGASSPQRRHTGGSHLYVAPAFGSLTRNAETEDTDLPTPSDVLGQRHLNVKPTQQLIRPSSTRLSPRKMAPPMSPNQVTFGDPQHGQVVKEDWVTVQSENEQLRREISLLQQKLVEKMRGSAKILVSGGQFRAPASSPTASRNHVNSCAAAPVQPCGTCSSLRASSKKARESADHEQRVLAFRISQLERAESEAQTSRNQHEGEVSSLRQQLAHALSNDGATNAKLKSQSEVIKHLQEDAERLQRENEALRLQATAHDASHGRRSELTTSTETQTDHGCMSNDCNHLGRLEAEAVQLQLHENQAAYVALQRSYTELRAELSGVETQRTQALREYVEEREVTQERLARYQEDCSVLKRHNKTLLENVADLETTLQTLHGEISASQTTSNNRAAMWQQELAARDQRIASLEGHKAEFQATVSAAQHHTVELDERLAATQEKVHFLETQVRVAVQEIEGLTQSLCAKTTELAAMKKQCELAHAETLATQEALKKSHTELKSCQDESSRLRHASDELCLRLAAAEAEIDAREEVHTQARRSHSAALEKAMQSVVRLCVVAPTVNVHLTNNSSGGGGGGSLPAVSCKSALPHQQVRAVVEQDVLPLFATLFVQPHESCSPQGGPMDTWLQSLLREMQESLATHLQKLYSSTTTAASAD